MVVYLSTPRIGVPKIEGPSIMNELELLRNKFGARGYIPAKKMHHWSRKRRRKEFYDLLDAGEITIVVGEDM